MQPRTFAVTAPAGEVRLNDSRKGEVTYTVTNESERPQRALARVTPLEGAKPEWFSVSGELEREVPIKGTQQYVVAIEVPSGVPEGTGKVRLDIVSAERGTEFSSEGPTVVFRIPQADKPPSLVPWIIAGAAVLVVAGGVVAWLLLKKEVPGVEGKPIADARTLLAKEELTLAIVGTGYDSSAADSTILSQDPKAGTKMPEDKTVDVTVNAHTVALPNLTGQDFAVASLALSELSLVPIPQRQTSNSAEYSVVNMQPPAGTIVRRGDQVTIYFAMHPQVSTPFPWINIRDHFDRVMRVRNIPPQRFGRVRNRIFTNQP